MLVFDATVFQVSQKLEAREALLVSNVVVKDKSIPDGYAQLSALKL